MSKCELSLKVLQITVVYIESISSRVSHQSCHFLTAVQLLLQLGRLMVRRGRVDTSSIQVFETASVVLKGFNTRSKYYLCKKINDSLHSSVI